MALHVSKQVSGRSRRRTGILLALVGVLLNLLLFTLKYTAGRLSGSIAVTADGYNNLADTGSCILTMTGFLIGYKKPSRRYPMGFGRLEYLSGLLISAAILMIGIRMLFCSFGKIISPAETDGCPTVIAILLASIVIKGTMYLYNRRLGKRLQSSAMRAAALDSLSDCFATFAILSAILIEKLSGFRADGYTGVLVALCILYAGLTSVRESAAPLLGKAPDPDTSRLIREMIRSHEGVRAVDTPILHDYGPEKKLLTFSLDADDPLETIMTLQHQLTERLGITVMISPMDDENHDGRNNRRTFRPQYLQTKETQECESYEHQTR